MPAMKVLIIPPEELVPTHAPLSGIFQFHQALALQQRGLDIAIVSVCPSIAVKPLLISLGRHLLGLKTYYNPVRGKGIYAISRLILSRLFAQMDWKLETIHGMAVLRMRMPCWSDIDPKESLAYFEASVKKSFKLLAGIWGRPDILHAHNAWLAGTAAYAISIEEGIPVCITEHSTFYARGLVPEKCFPLLRDVYAHAAVNMVVSASLGEKLRSAHLLASDAKVLPNLLDPVFEEELLVEAPTGGPFVFLNVAELTAKKGHVYLIHAFSRAFGQSGKARLVIAGEGDLDHELRTLVHQLGLAEWIVFTGRLNRKAVMEKMQHCHVFVLPSLVETFGVVLIEALSCGRPVIASICGGPEEIINESNGMLIPSADIDALCEAMLFMASGDWSFDPQRIRQAVLDRYGAQPISEALMITYREIIGQ